MIMRVNDRLRRKQILSKFARSRWKFIGAFKRHGYAEAGEQSNRRVSRKRRLKNWAFPWGEFEAGKLGCLRQLRCYVYGD